MGSSAAHFSRTRDEFVDGQVRFIGSACRFTGTDSVMIKPPGEKDHVQHLRILHLEDDLVDAELLSLTLIEAGMPCDVLRVDTRPGFVQALQQREFDLIISDLSLPGFDGSAALEIVRQQYPDIPFIFVSGTIGEEAAIESLLSGATDYVLKHKFSRLIPAVQRAQRETGERKKQRQTEQELALTSTQLQHLFDNLDDVFFSVDTIQPQLLQLSPSCERMSGWPAREFFNNLRLWEDCIHEQDKAATIQLISGVETGESVRCEFRILKLDGTIRWIEAKLKPAIDQVGRLVRVDGVLNDITERKRSEEALRASEERYRQLFESNPHPMWVYDVETLVFLAVNAAAVKGYGYSRNEFLRMRMEDLAPSKDYQPLSDNLPQNSQEFERHESWRHRRKDGTIIDVEVASHELSFLGRAGRLVLANDVSEKKKIETQLLRAQRIESIGTLASGIAHDLNNILAPILMGVQLLRETSSDDHNCQTIDTLEMSARRGADLVKQVLTFARGIGGRGALQVRHLLGEIDKILIQTLPKSIRLVSEVQNDLWVVAGDGTQLHQLFMNLCINARDAMAVGGVLTLSASNVTIDETWTGNGEIKAGSYVAVEVSDTGEGIPRNCSAKSLSRFLQQSKPVKGRAWGCPPRK